MTAREFIKVAAWLLFCGAGIWGLSFAVEHRPEIPQVPHCAGTVK